MTTAIRKTEREYGLDLLRSLSMVFVIVLHLIGHGGLGGMYQGHTAGGFWWIWPIMPCIRR